MTRKITEPNVKILITLNDQGGAQMSWNYDEKAATLRANTKHHEPIVVITDEAEDSIRNHNKR